MGRSSKIRHRRRNRQARALHACERELELAVAESLRAVEGVEPPKDSHVILDPCTPLPGFPTPVSSEGAGGPGLGGKG